MKPCANFDQNFANQSNCKQKDFSLEDRKNELDKIFWPWDESHPFTTKTFLDSFAFEHFFTQIARRLSKKRGRVRRHRWCKFKWETRQIVYTKTNWQCPYLHSWSHFCRKPQLVILSPFRRPGLKDFFFINASSWYERDRFAGTKTKLKLASLFCHRFVETTTFEFF